jgi:hypothetical protein
MTVNVTLTFPEKVIEKIDADRHDVNRSKYIVKLIEEAYRNSTRHCDNNKKLLQRTDSPSYQLNSQSFVAATRTTSLRDDSLHE